MQMNHNCPLTPFGSSCNVPYTFHRKQTPPFSPRYIQTLQHPPLLLSATKLFGNFPLVVSIISLLSFFLTHPGFGPVNFHLKLPVTLVLLISCSVLHTLLGTQHASHSSDTPPLHRCFLHCAPSSSHYPVCSNSDHVSVTSVDLKSLCLWVALLNLSPSTVILL